MKRRDDEVRRLHEEAPDDERDDLGAALRATLDAEAMNVDVLPGIEAALAQKGKKVRSVPTRRVRWAAAAGALLAAAAAILVLARSPVQTNACDIESLEVDGVVASVFKSDDATVLFAEEE
jgi:hypothetical protein